MKKGDKNPLDDFWIQFFFGFLFGAVIGFRMGCGWFDSDLAIAATSMVVALVMALCCGRWGDSVWEKVIWLVCWLVP